MNDSDAAPQGFDLFPQGLGFADVLAPLYIKRDPQQVTLGLMVKQPHLNGINICHGGVLMMLADICCAWNLRAHLPEGVAPPTLALSFDFIKAARAGDWLETRLELLEVKNKVGFAGGTIRCNEKTAVRFNGTFYIPAEGSFAIRQELAERYKVDAKPED